MVASHPTTRRSRTAFGNVRLSILVFGHSGQVATELGKDAEVTALPRAEVDLTDPSACTDAILNRRPRAVINAAAFTAVDSAESAHDEARQVNAAAPEAMAKACLNLQIPFVHISTDYVFDGTGNAPRNIDDKTGPLQVYGQSKLDGEARIMAVGGCHTILRTSWVFSEHGANFVKTMLRLAATRDELSVVADQVGGPTPAPAIADACLRIARASMETGKGFGVQHFTGYPDTSWADFAREIFVLAGKGTVVHDIATSDYPTPATRPLNSRLNCTALEEKLGIVRPDWKAHLKDLMEAGRLAQ